MDEKQALIDRWNKLNDRAIELLEQHSDFSAYLRVRLQMDVVEDTLYTYYNININEGME